MSFKFLIPVTVVFTGALFGYTLVNYLKPETANRFVASMPISKLGLQQNARSLFDVQTDLSGLAVVDSEISILKVSIEAIKPVSSGLFYKWTLPPGAQLVSGAESESLPSLSAGQKLEILIKVKGFSKQQRKYASFAIDGNINNFRIQRELLLSSRVEDSLEYRIQQSELKKEKNGINKMGTKANGRFDPKNIVH